MFRQRQDRNDKEGKIGGGKLETYDNVSVCACLQVCVLCVCVCLCVCLCVCVCARAQVCAPSVSLCDVCPVGKPQSKLPLLSKL